MAFSRIPEPLGARPPGEGYPRTPGPLGINDQTDPSVFALIGDGPGALGSKEYLGYRISSLNELRLFIATTPNFAEVEDTMLKLLGTMPQELIDGDFA
jgi:hypothetical protein